MDHTRQDARGETLKVGSRRRLAFGSGTDQMARWYEREEQAPLCAVEAPFRQEVVALAWCTYLVSIGLVFFAARPAWAARVFLLAVVCALLAGLGRAYRVARLLLRLSDAVRQATQLSIRSPRLLSDAELRRVTRTLAYWRQTRVVALAVPSQGPYARVRMDWASSPLGYVQQRVRHIESWRPNAVGGRLSRVANAAAVETRRTWALYSLVMNSMLAVMGAALFLVLGLPGSRLAAIWPAVGLALVAGLFLPTGPVMSNYRIAVYRCSYRAAWALVRIGRPRAEAAIRDFAAIVAARDVDDELTRVRQEAVDRSQKRPGMALGLGVAAAVTLILIRVDRPGAHNEPVNWRSPSTVLGVGSILVAAVVLATTLHAWLRRRRIARNKRRVLGLLLDGYDDLPPEMRGWAEALSAQIDAYQDETAFGASFGLVLGLVVSVLAIVVALVPSDVRVHLLAWVTAVRNALTSL